MSILPAKPFMSYSGSMCTSGTGTMRNQRDAQEKVGLLEEVLKWSCGDILNANFYAQQVGVIPDKFSSVKEYRSAFRVPLLEELRAQVQQGLQKSMISGSILPVQIHEKVLKNRKRIETNVKKHVALSVRLLQNRKSLGVHRSDLMLLCGEVPKWDSDLELVIQTPNILYILAYVDKAEDYSPLISVRVSAQDGGSDLVEKLKSSLSTSWYAVILDTGLVPTSRIWSALHWPIPSKYPPETSVIQEILDIQPQKLPPLLQEILDSYPDWVLPILEDSIHDVECELWRCNLEKMSSKVNDSRWLECMSSFWEYQRTPSGSDSLLLPQGPQEGGILQLVNAYCNHRSLNASQSISLRSAVSSLLANDGTPHVRIIQGPPGTGKTSMLVSLLSVVGSLDCRTLVSAPTNAAVLEVCRRIMSFFDTNAERKQETFSDFCEKCRMQETSGCSSYSGLALSDIVVVGSRRLRGLVEGDAVDKVFLPQRVKRLRKALHPLTGWRSSSQALEKFLNDAPSQHQAMQGTRKSIGNSEAPDSSGTILNTQIVAPNGRRSNGKEWSNQGSTSFWSFAKRKMVELQVQIENSSKVLTTELPKDFLDNRMRKSMTSASKLMKELLKIMPLESPADATVWFTSNANIDAITADLSRTRLDDNTTAIKSSFLHTKVKLLEILRQQSGYILLKSAKYPQGRSPNSRWLEKECVRNASLVFSTVSSGGGPLLAAGAFKLAIIDEASQLVEAETTIITRRIGLKQLILVGDQKQLPATVISQVAKKCGYGRSLFDRLQAAQHGCRHLLDMQYRMNPAISRFPNSKFYGGQIRDGPNVLHVDYGRSFDQFFSYGAYAFLDCNGCEVAARKSLKNPTEIQIVSRLVSSLHKICAERNLEKLSIGVISPYATQVEELKRSLSNRIHDGLLHVDVKTVDGFQGNERDVILFSAVRANGAGRIGFVDDVRRLNVAITRARHCMWIVGNARTLSRGGVVWNDLIEDAKARNCFHTLD